MRKKMSIKVMASVLAFVLTLNTAAPAVSTVYAASVEDVATETVPEEETVTEDETLVEGEETPEEDAETPVEGEETPEEDVKTPVEDEETPEEDVKTPVEDVEIPVEGEETPEEDVEAPVEEEEIEAVAEEETTGEDSEEGDATEEDVTLPEVTTTDYKTFIARLKVLEEYAADYAGTSAYKGEDQIELIVNYIRTGVERYTSGSWKILAGDEITGFTRFVEQQDEANGTDVRGLKNLEEFRISNGDTVDFGHMFGCMNVTYRGVTNPTKAQDYADLGGWAGDIADLMEQVVNLVEVTDVETMRAEIFDKYLAKEATEGSGFDIVDVYGDLDAFYIMNSLSGGKNISKVMENYFNTNLTDEGRSNFFVENRFGETGTKEAFREAVYTTYYTNDILDILEGSKELTGDVSLLRQASCYAFADWIYERTGAVSNMDSNRYYTVFSSERSNLAPGITQQIDMADTADGKKIAYHIAVADITRDDVDIYANYANNSGSVWQMARVEDQMLAAVANHTDPSIPEKYIPNYTAVVGVNGDFYNMSTGQPSGALVMEGVTYQGAGSENFFAILDDGTPILAAPSEWNTYKDRVKEAIGGNIFLVKDGKIVISHTDNYYNSRASRTCVGITADNKIVVMVLDGRQEPYSAGGSMIELAQIMKEAGCVNAINLDGGGSTTFVAKQEGSDGLSVVNSPSDGYARSVSSSLLIVSTAKPSTEFDHALIVSDYDYMTVGTSVDVSAKGVNASGGSSDLPEGTYLQVSNEAVGSLKDGVFTAKSTGDVIIYAMVGDEIVGKKTLHVVVPDELAFEATHINAIYGVKTTVPVMATYKGNTVKINESDITLSLGNTEAGILEGLSFTGIEKSGIRTVKVVVALSGNAEINATLQIYLYKENEATFDFDNVTGGGREFAWKRAVSNANSSDGETYYIEKVGEENEISYTFGIDMKYISIPEHLLPLVSMLPGGDKVDATAWDFLCQLAERVSIRTHVETEVKFDKNYDVDYSGVTVVSEYFQLEETSFDEETNTLKIKFTWIDQTEAVDPSTANSICILSGIKMTPKADTEPLLDTVVEGNVKYDIFLRANALYTEALDKEFQETFKVYPFCHEDIIYNDGPEKGGHLAATFVEIEDTFKLNRKGKEGWMKEVDGSLCYYVNNEKCTGIQFLPGYLDEGNSFYYEFDENGVSQGKISGLFELDGNLYYAANGVLKKGWQGIKTDYYYFDTTTGAAANGTQSIYSDVYGRSFTYEFTDYILTKGELVKDSKGTRYMWAGDYATQMWLTIDGNVSYATQSGYFYTKSQNIPGPDGNWRWYIFDDNGVWRQELDGMWVGDLYQDDKGNYRSAYNEDGEYTFWAEDGIWVVYPGLVKYDGGYYYFASNGTLSKGPRTFWISKANGYMPEGSYSFDANGRMLNPPVYPTAITLGETAITVNAKGDEYELKATLESENSAAVKNGVEWTSSDESVATVAPISVSKNIVKAGVQGHSAGTAEITVTTKNGKTATCTVTVLAPVKKISLEDLIVARGSKASVKATIDPVVTTDKLTWTTSDDTIATVDANGEVTAIAKGEAKITVTAESGKTATCTVTVNVPTESITLNKEALTLDKGTAEGLTVAATPVDTTDTVTWTSSNEAVATVDANGTVTAVGKGTADITATAESGAKAVCAVTVKVPATKVVLSAAELTLNKGEVGSLTAVLNPTDSTDTVTWTTSDETIATVDADGKVTAVAAGTVEIAATATSGVTAVCTVTVYVPAVSVTLNKTELTLIKGTEESLTATVAPEDSTDKAVWTTSDETVVTVTNDGKVTAVGVGNAVITATVGNVSAECAVTVKVPSIGVTLSETELVLHSGTSHTLVATMTPDDATDALNWTTSDATVATVDENGLVKALDKIGTATITVTTEAGFTASCEVTVKKSADSVALDYTELSLQPETVAELTATMTPADVEEKITWTSSDENVVAVAASSDGMKATVKANGFGTATITATTTSGLTATCTVVVEIKADSIELNKTAVTLYKGEADVLISAMLPADTTDEVAWTTSDEAIVTVSEIGEIVALEEGTATITATTTSGKTAVCEVTVIGVPAVAVKLNKTKVTVNRGKTYTLKATLDPADVTDEIIWTSSNEEVATVDENGVVTAVSGITGGGKVKITATTVGGETAECEVTVKDVRSTSIKLSKTTLTVNKGKTATLKATLSKGTTDTVTWTTSDEAIATVDEKGKVTAVKPGTAIITATATSGLRAACQVTVNSPATAVVLSEKTVSMNTGETYLLSAVMDPEDTTDALTWSTSNKKVATVAEDGTVTAVAKGSATITVKTTSGKKAICKVTVLLPADSVKLNATEATLVKGKSLTLKATLGPKGTTDKVTWTTSDETVVVVDAKGKVTVVGDGEATITATTTSGLTATCKVTVNDVPAETVKLNKTAVTVNRGKTYNLKATLAPKTSTDFVTWTSSNEDVATVDANGVVTAVSGITGDGKATITATASSGVTAVCVVTVKDTRATSIKLSKAEATVNKGKSLTLKATLSKGTTDTVTWTTSNEAIATVDVKGKITAVAPGTVTITATTTSELTAACEVTVKSPATKVTVEKTVALNEGETYKLSAVITPDDTTDTVTWSSSNKKVATVAEDGTVTAVAKGSATITVKTTSGKKATCKVTVLRPATELKLLKGKEEVSSVAVNKGKSVTLKASMTAGTTDKVTWTTRNENIAKVSTSGKVTGVSRGTTILVAETTSGVQVYCLVTVNVPATKVVLSSKSLTMNVGETTDLTATLTPITTTDDITWTSSKESAAIVDENGTVTAVGVGKATITVKTTSGKTAKCTITVK